MHLAPIFYGSASNPVFGWKYQVHAMNVFDPVPHVCGRGIFMLPVAAFDAFRPNVDQQWYLNAQGIDGWWYHSWDPSYKDKPARKP